jgi:putative oxidoreductase
VGVFERLAATNAPGAVLAIRLLVGGVFFLERTKKFLFADQWGAGRLARIGIPASWGLVAACLF